MNELIDKYEDHDNNEIENYLEYYIQLKSSPGYAVFLNGPWGSGKTWFIKKFREKHGKERFLHTSLYGITSIEGIEDQIFQQTHPILSSKPFLFTVKGIKSALGKYGISTDHFDLKDYISKSNDKILIFDDLERCLIKDEALGYINRFIEHAGNKVIILGDESKIDDETFKEKKEKTIGRYFTLNPEFKKTFNHLIEQEDHAGIRELLNNNYERVKSCFKRSSCNNLRTLKFCIMEFQRFFDQLPLKAQTHFGFIEETINTFFSLCIEIRSGNIKVSDVLIIQDAFTSDIANQASNRNKSEQDPPNPLAELRKRHFGEGFNEIDPNLNLLYCFFEYGSTHKQMMKEAIDNCSYFIEDKTPSWVKLGHYHSISDSVFKQCYEEVLSDYKSYKFTKPGEIRHIVGILLAYSKINLIDLTYAAVIALNLEVINGMSAKELIEQDEKDDDYRPFDDFFNGMKYQSYEDENFQAMSKLLKECHKKAQERKNEDVAKEIPALIIEDGKKFWSLIAPGRNHGVDFQLYKTPVMKHVNINDFINALIEMDPTNAARFTVFGALKDRYSNTHSYPDLKEDLNWLEELKKQMELRLPGLQQPTKQQFKEMVVNLGNIIETVRKVNT